MEKTIGVLQTVLPVIVMLGIGMLLRAKKLISREGINTLKFVVVNITLPAVLFSAFATTRYTWMDVVIPLLMFLVCLAGWALGKVAAKVLHLSSRFVPFLTTGFEAGMLGYALYNMLYGSASTADFARIDLGQVLFVFTLYKILLGLDGSKKADVKELMREMVFSPIIVAIAAGVLLGATGLYQALVPSGIAGILDACTNFVSAPTSAVILLTIGYDLVLGDIPWASTGKIVALRFVIMMILRTVLIGILRVLMPSVNLTNAINVMFIPWLPSPVLPCWQRWERKAELEMLAGTHLTIGLASALAICDPRNIDQAAPVIIGAAVGSIICDMDSRDTSRIRDALYGRVIGAAVVGITVIWNAVQKGVFWETLMKIPLDRGLIGIVLFALSAVFAKKSGHRGYSHSLAALIIYAFALYMIDARFVLPFEIGFVSHILLDLTNKTPIRIFFPVKRGFCFNWFYANRAANAVCMGLGIIWLVYELNVTAGIAL